MTKKEGIADAYAAATDSTRHLVRWTRNNARQEQRIKPDEETHLLAELDYEKEQLDLGLLARAIDHLYRDHPFPAT